MESPGILFLAEQEMFLFCTKWPDRFGTHRGCLPASSWSGCESEHSSQYSAEVKNNWRYTSIPSIHLHGVQRRIRGGYRRGHQGAQLGGVVMLVSHCLYHNY